VQKASLPVMMHGSIVAYIFDNYTNIRRNNYNEGKADIKRMVRRGAMLEIRE